MLKNNIKTSFVILHYRTYIDTIECVESIKKLEGEFDIVIVDNYSDNGSIEIIEERYAREKNIYILKNKANLGFSVGNNVGYDFAKNTLHADFIFISNNDIVVDDNKLLYKTLKFYFEHPFCVCGPDIISLVDGGHQNPKEDSIPNLRKARTERIRYLFLYLLSKFNVYDFIKNRKPKIRKVQEKKIYKDKYIDDIMLHGSFLIFSPMYVKNEKYAFQPGPFLYCEEAILFHYCKRKRYLMTYLLEISVNHKEDSSTNDLCENDKKKREFVFWNMYKSLGVLTKVIKKR